MRGFDRDLIRGGHYGQRSCEPHLKAEHMAAPTNAANVKKALANSEPSTHGTKLQPPPALNLRSLFEEVRRGWTCGPPVSWSKMTHLGPESLILAPCTALD